MHPLLLLPFLLGSLVVFQPVLNRLILEQKGLAFAAWLNSLVLIGLSTSVLLLSFYLGDRVPLAIRPRWEGGWRWWYVLPGMMGFALVFSVPLAIRKLGAFPCIIALLLGQLLTSFLYDFYAFQKPLSAARLTGLILALVGAYLSLRPAE